MSKHLVQKALGLLQDDIKLIDKSQDNSKPSAKKYKKSEQKGNSNFTKRSSEIPPKVDRTAENIRILKKLKQLKPKSSVAEKVVKYYMQSTVDESTEKPEVQRSILFDDDEDDKKKRKKRRKDKDDSF